MFGAIKASFLVQLPKPISASARVHDQRVFNDVSFEPFSDLPPDGLEFDGVLSLGYTALPSTRFADLAGRVFEFETRCALNGVYPDLDDYTCIEGSIYFAHAGQPVYLSSLGFGAAQSGQIPLHVKSI